MSGPSIKNNIGKTDPALKDLLDLHKKDIMLSLNCHAIATVQSVNLSEKVLTATINYSKTFFEKNAEGVYVPVQVPYPILVDVPFIILGGGGGSLTFPISSGDECLILFNDRDLDNWFAGANSGPVASSRLHSFSDGLALVGFNFSVAIDPSRATLAKGSAKVGVSDSKVLVANNLHTLNAVLQDLVNAIKAIVTSGGQSVSGGSQANLSSVASEISALLD